MQSRGVYYCAPDLSTAIAETFQTKRHVSFTWNQPRLVGWFPFGPLELLDLLSDWPTRAGCDQRIHSTPARQSTRAWSQAIYEAFPAIGGLRYRSKLGGEASWCLYERCQGSLPSQPVIDLPIGHGALRSAIEATCISLGYSFDS